MNLVKLLPFFIAQQLGAATPPALPTAAPTTPAPAPDITSALLSALTAAAQQPTAAAGCPFCGRAADNDNDNAAAAVLTLGDAVAKLTARINALEKEKENESLPNRN